MNKFRLALTARFIFLLILNCAASMSATAKEPSSTHKAPSFWKVEGEHSTVWLFGSIHLLTEGHYPFPAKIERAFEESPNVVVEVDVLTIDTAATQNRLARDGRLPQNESLRDWLGDAEYRRAQSLAAASGYDLANMEGLRPWLIMLSISMSEYAKLGFTQDQGVEQYFLQRAHRDNKQIVELETLDSQLSIFTSMKKDTEIAGLMHTLEQLSAMPTQITALIAAWEGGDLEKLGKELLKEFDNFPEINQQLVISRNRAWVDQLTEVLNSAKEDHFVTVGALHMVGENGVVQLLKNKGYKVRAL